jgi:hypothetical protein
MYRNTHDQQKSIPLLALKMRIFRHSRGSGNPGKAYVFCLRNSVDIKNFVSISRWCCLDPHFHGDDVLYLHEPIFWTHS